MNMWQQFVIIASAHFLALLSPGPDFFLIIRSALRHGWRRASGVCSGIAVANGVFITLALCGVAFVQQASGAFLVLKWGGCIYLAWLGWRLLSYRGATDISAAGGQTDGAFAESVVSGWLKEFGTGFLSGILNPKNSLFYASLFSLVVSPKTPSSIQALYGVWMFVAVLGWDLLVAAAAGHPVLVKRFVRHIRGIERGTGVVLLTLSAAVALAWR